MALTPKQQRFVEEYLIDLNATQAYLRAGYKVKPASARVQSCRLLADPNIALAIEEAKARRSERVEITQDRVLQEIARIAFFDVRKLYREAGGMLDPHELDDDAAAVLVGVDIVEETEAKEGGGREVTGYVKKAKLADKVAALTLAARHLGMLKDKTELSGEIGIRSLAAKMRERAQKGTQ
jgi:phage terminase small subunit